MVRINWPGIGKASFWVLVTALLGTQAWVLIHHQREIRAQDERISDCVPLGTIVAWTPPASVADPRSAAPKGWRICDGSAGVPDLRSRFLLGSSEHFAAGSIGGSSRIEVVPADLVRATGDVIRLDEGKQKISRTHSHQLRSADEQLAEGETLPPYYSVLFIIRVEETDVVAQSNTPSVGSGSVGNETEHDNLQHK